MTKRSLNSTLHRAIKEVSTEALDEAHDMLIDLERPFHYDDGINAAQHLVYVALGTAAAHLWQELLIRQAKQYRRQPKPTDQGAITRWAQKLDDRSLEQNLMREHRHVLMYRHELARDRFIPDDERESAQTHERLYAALTAEVERRDIADKFTANLDLRNQNFTPDDEQFKHRLAQQTAQFLRGIAPDMWGETRRLCERDVEIAMETGEMALIYQERHMLDAVRRHITENNVVLEAKEAP